MRKLIFIIFLSIFYIILKFYPLLAVSEKQSVVEETLNRMESQNDQSQFKTNSFQAESGLSKNSSGLNEIETQNQSVKINIDFKDTDIREALEEIQQKSGLNIVAGPEIRGQVSFTLENIGVWDALMIILKTNQLAYVKENDSVRILTGDEFESYYGHKFAEKTEVLVYKIVHSNLEEMLSKLNAFKSSQGKIFLHAGSQTLILLDSKEQLKSMGNFLREADVPIEIIEFQLHYITVNEIKEKIKSMLTKSIGQMEFDESLNKIVITDSSEKIKDMSKIIQELDKKREVLIEAKVFQIRLNEKHKEGIDWQAIVSNYQGWDLAGLPSREPFPQSQVSLGTISHEDYHVLLEALDAAGEIKNLATATTTAIINQETEVILNSDIDNPKSPQDNHSNAAEYRDPVSKKDFAIKMIGKPVLQDKSLILKNFKSYVRMLFTENHSENNHFIDIQFPQTGAVVKVSDQEMIVMGGLMREKEFEYIAKIPFLGDLPLVGTIFRTQNTRRENIEYIIFLIPKLAH